MDTSQTISKTNQKATHNATFFSTVFKMLLLASTASIAVFTSSSMTRAEDLMGASPGASNGSIGGAGNGWGGSAGGGNYNFVSSNGNGGRGQHANGLGGSGGDANELSADMIIVGGAGQQGQPATYGGNAVAAGGGGGGGAGVNISQGSNTTLAGQVIAGGAGGAGGMITPNASPSYDQAMAGSGGGGGAGALITGGALVNVQGATITGGQGGVGGSSTDTSAPDSIWNWGGHGAGGDGVVVNAGAQLENFGSVRGGDGVDVSTYSNIKSNGGAGIRVADDGYVINGGWVAAGTSYGQGAPTNAIEINGNNATLELHYGSDIQGNVVVANGKTGNTLALGGANSDTFAANEIGSKYVGFDGYKKTGTGTWTLTGATAEKTPWTIEQGTLVVSQNGSLGSIDSALTLNGGTLQSTSGLSLEERDIVIGGNGGTIDNSNGWMSIGGEITGTGKLVKEGGGGLYLGSDSSFSGDFEVKEGILHFSEGSVKSDIILNGGDLNISRSNSDLLLDNHISGTGNVSKAGTATVVVTADNTYTGTTTINGGTLQIGNGGTTGSIDATSGVTVGANGTFAFNRSDDITFDRVISGSGIVRQTNSNLINLTGDSSAFTGTTFVEAGTLAVNGSLGGAIDVETGADLIGTGTVGATLFRDGAFVAPGNGALGTLSTNGNFAQLSGSTYQAELDRTNGNDLIAVTGTATLEDGAILEINKLGNEGHELERRYTILTATNGVTGKYNLVGDTRVSAFYRLEDQYDPNSVSIKVNQFRQFQEAGATPNQIAAASGAQSLKHLVDGTPGYETNGRPVNELFRAIAYLPDDQIAQYAFDQISGEIYGSTQVGILEDSHFVREATSKRLRESFDDSKPAAEGDAAYDTVFWTNGYGAWSTTDGDGNAADFKRNIGGFFAGIDTAVAENIRIGMLGGYSRSTFKVNDRHSEAKSDNYDLGIYGGGQWNGFGINAGLNYTWHKVETDRTVAFADFYETLNSDYKANTFQVYGDISYKLDLGQAKIEPFAGLAYVKLDRDGYNELGGVSALYGSKEKMDATFSTLGVRGSTLFDLSGVSLTANGMLGWRHAFDGDLSDVTHKFAGGTDFTVSGVPLAKDVAVIEAGLSTKIDQNITLGISYVGQFGGRTKENGLRGSFIVNF